MAPLNEIVSDYNRVRLPELGLVCLNTKLRARNIFCSRTMRLASVCASGGLDTLKAKCLDNCRNVKDLLIWNDLHQIPALRLSSEMFPHKSNPEAPQYTLDFAQPILTEVGILARSLGQRLTFHPGQYNVVATPHENIFAKTVADLDWHAEVLDRIGCDQDSIMVVHGGGLYGNKERTIERWVRNYHRLPERIKRRLVLENCEKNFNVEDCLRISEMINIPVVFDTHHHDCYIKMHPRELLGSGASYMTRVLQTWDRRDIKPKFHVSEQRVGSNIGAHSDFVQTVPEYLSDISLTHPKGATIMIEAKAKEQAILHLYQKWEQEAYANDYFT